jgi:hypothetical protein
MTSHPGEDVSSMYFCLTLSGRSIQLVEATESGPMDHLPRAVSINILSRFRGVDWWIDLLTTYTHNSELQVITALLVISTLYKLSHHSLSLFPACCSFIIRSITTATNSGGSLVSSPQVLLWQPPVQNSTHSTRAPFFSPLCRAHLNCQPSTELVVPVLFFITTLHGPNRKHNF